MSSSDEEEKLVNEFWVADVELPHIEVEDYDERGKRRTEETKEHLQSKEVKKFLKEETLRQRARIPVRFEGRHGGKHELQVQWTPEEDAALMQVLPLGTLRPCWTTVTLELAEHCPKTASRTLKSVRSRWNRLTEGRRARTTPSPFGAARKNRCSACGQLRRGHICPGRAGRA